jgi:antitoxin ChpS
MYLLCITFKARIMETSIKRLGNSVGILLPSGLVRALNLSVGQSVNIESIDGNLVVKPKIAKRYTLKELVAQCNPKAPMPVEIKEWENMPLVGLENNG